MNESEKTPAEVIWDEVRFLRQLVFFQSAQIEALMLFSTAHVADLARIEREKSKDQLLELISKAYEKVLLQMGERYPKIADDIDIRKGLDGEPTAQYLFRDWEKPEQT